MRRQAKWVSLVLAIAVFGRAWAGELPRTTPEEVGFSAQRLNYIDSYFADKVNKGELAGIVTLISRHGKIVHFGAVGFADVEQKRKMKTDDIFRIYSMTKPIASSALMMLYEEGRFQLDAPLSAYIPEFAGLRVLRNPDAGFNDTVPPERPPTVQDIFRHTAGFTHGIGVDAFDAQYTKANVFGLDTSLSEMMHKLSGIPLRYQPGTRFVYSLGPDIQARLVEILSGMPFDEFLEKRMFKPLGMKDTGFWVPADKVSRLATVHWSKDGKLVPLDEAHGHPKGGVLVEPWSVNSYTKNNKHKGGSFGLVSTAEDYWRFAQTMLNRGQLNGARILGPRTVDFMARDHMASIAASATPEAGNTPPFGLGFGVTKDPATAGYIDSEGSFFWSGAAATVFWIDPKEDMVAVAMTQHMGATDMKGPNSQSLTRQLHALVYAALIE